MRNRRRSPRTFEYALVVPMLALAGCEKAMQDMYNQPKYKPLAVSSFWPDGRSSRPEVAGTVAHSGGATAGTSSGYLGRLPLPVAEAPVYPVDEQGNVKADLTPDSPKPLTARNPLPINHQTLERGQQRFDIYCAPCHGRTGPGDGMIVQRGFPHPPSYFSDTLMHAPNQLFYDVISHGYGAMYSYADRVAPADRWAIVAYIRALQASMNGQVADVPPERRGALK